MDKDETSWQMEGDELVPYQDSFKVVSQEDVERALEIENQIVAITGQISKGYLEIARFLAEFKEKKYYKARGSETFDLWCESENLKHIGKRTAHDLIRIYNEVLPILAKHDAMDVLPMIGSSTMRAMLPILADENAEEKLVEAAYAVKDLTVKDAYATIADIRGTKDRFEERDLPTIFSATVSSGNIYNTIEILCLDPEDTYRMGSLKIRKKDWPAWEKRFGRFVEIVE